MKKNPWPQLLLAGCLLGGAGFLTARWWRDTSGVSEKAFYYDLSEKQLFVGLRGEVAPVRGINDATEDGVRAVVVSTNGLPDRKSTWRIAYLETYAPELQAELRAAQRENRAPRATRADAQSLRLVKRVTDAQWVSLSSAEGELIVGEWTRFGTDQMVPVVCNP